MPLSKMKRGTIYNMKILMSGAGGLIGSEVKQRLQERGDEVMALSRSPREGAISWPEGAAVNAEQLHGFDAVIHLAGESVGGRWTKAKKAAIYDSRVQRTRQLCAALAQVPKPPRAFLCASAIGIYGNRGGEELTENSAPGTGFLAEVCRDWEAACAPLQEKSQSQSRIAHLRFGVVLSEKGGVLGLALLPFKLGLGGALGDGLQFMSWISLSDAARAVLHILDSDLCDAFNIVAPHPVRNYEFTQQLAKTLKRPAPFPLPAFALRLLLNDFADEGLLSSQRVLPQRLMQSGFEFEHETLAQALAQATE